MKIDLKQTHETLQVAPASIGSSEDYYPCAYIGSTKADLSDVKIDQNVKLEGRVKSITRTERDGKVSYSADIELISMEPEGSKKNPFKKKTVKDDEDEIEEGLKKTEEEKEDE